MASEIRAVFFDLGGTLFSNVDIPKISFSVLLEAARRLGVDEELGPIGAAYIKATRLANEALMNDRFYMHRDLFLGTYKHFADFLGKPATSDFLDWFYEAQRDNMVTKIRLRPDCIETLKVLRDRGLCLGIVSNIDDDFLHPMIDNLALAPVLDHWSSSEEAESCKPDRGIFELALRKADCAADEVVFVGDSQQHDIQGAGAMGMTTVLIKEPGGRSPLDAGDAEPHHIISALSELIALVDAIGIVKRA
jgi:HAD superfamily hydrolase (TIGR01509 family)